jgi:hypothetical protein
LITTFGYHKALSIAAREAVLNGEPTIFGKVSHDNKYQIRSFESMDLSGREVFIGVTRVLTPEEAKKVLGLLSF